MEKISSTFEYFSFWIINNTLRIPDSYDAKIAKFSGHSGLYSL